MLTITLLRSKQFTRSTPPENWDDNFSFEKAYFQVRTVSCREGIQPETLYPLNQLGNPIIVLTDHDKFPLATGRFPASLYSFATLRKELGGNVAFQKGYTKWLGHCQKVAWPMQSCQMWVAIHFLFLSLPWLFFKAFSFVFCLDIQGKIAKITQDEDEALTETRLGMGEKILPVDNRASEVSTWPPGWKWWCFFFVWGERKIYHCKALCKLVFVSTIPTWWWISCIKNWWIPTGMGEFNIKHKTM